MATSRTRTLVVTALASLWLVAGCTTPTGRTRGIVDGAAGSCLQSTPPTAGTFCRNAGESCSFDLPCGGNGTRALDCACSGNSWQCTQGNCETPYLDGGPLPCPTIPVRDGDRCTARQGGLFCAGTIADCVPDGGIQDTNCFCTGSRWSCREPSWCEVDAGNPDDAGDAAADANMFCPPALPTPVDRCMSGVDCVYPYTTCPVRCTCDPVGNFQCVLDCTADAGNPDVPD